MLKSFFGLFEVTESQLLPGAIRRLKWGSYLSFLFLPAVALAHFGYLEKGSIPFSLNVAAFLLGFLGFCLMGFARIFNRLWTPDRYLDEGEIARKREVNSFAFFWVMTALMVMLLFGALLIGAEVPAPDIFSDPSTVMGMMMLFVFFSMSLQGVKLSSMLQPMEAESGEVEKNRVDRYYGLFAVLYIVAVVGLAYGL